MTGCDTVLLALQIASEKDLEAVMAIDHYRGVELRKQLTEVCAGVIQGGHNPFTLFRQ